MRKITVLVLSVLSFFVVLACGTEQPKLNSSLLPEQYQERWEQLSKDKPGTMEFLEGRLLGSNIFRTSESNKEIVAAIRREFSLESDQDLVLAVVAVTIGKNQPSRAETWAV